MGEPGSDRLDSIEGLAADLRRRRLEAGSPTLARLQSETAISRSVISDAFAGKYLPSARTLDALARVLGGNPAEWIVRRDALANRRNVVAPADEPAEAVPAPVVAARAAGVPRRTAVLFAVSAFVLGALASGAISAIVASGLASPTATP